MQMHTLQVIDGVEASFLIHHANAYEDGDEVVVWSSGWSPEAVRLLASKPGSGMLGSWKVVMDGDFNDVPVSSLWAHRSVAGKGFKQSKQSAEFNCKNCLCRLGQDVLLQICTCLHDEALCC